MKPRILFVILATGIGIVLAGAPPAQPHRIGPAEIYPDPVRTPGAANPQVTRRNIGETICNPRWSTKLIRPPAEYTSRLKREQLREYGDTVPQTRSEIINPNTGKVDTTRCVPHSDNMACYEEDHLIPLEDGGDPTDPRNLWPEPYNTRVGGTIMGARQKDVVEAFVHDEICSGIPGSKKNSYIPATTSVTLRRGQEIAAGDWYSFLCCDRIRIDSISEHGFKFLFPGLSLDLPHCLFYLCRSAQRNGRHRTFDELTSIPNASKPQARLEQPACPPR